jgi:hypothetical protein
VQEPAVRLPTFAGKWYTGIKPERPRKSALAALDAATSWIELSEVKLGDFVR